MAFIATACGTPVVMGGRLPGNAWVWNAIITPYFQGSQHKLCIGIVPDPFPLESGLAMQLRDYKMATNSSLFIMVSCIICGNYVYKVVWSPVTAENFVWVAEEKNACDKYMVSPALLVSSNFDVR